MKKLSLLKFMMLFLFLGGAINAFAATKTSTLTFTAACKGSGTADDGVKWTVTSDGEESNFDTTSGIHYGTGKKAVTYLQLATSDIKKTITKVVVNARDAQEKGTVSVTVGGKAFGTSATATNTSKDYTFEGSATGEIIVKIDRGSSMLKAIYVKSIAVTYDDGSTKENPTFEYSAITATYTINESTADALPTLSNNSAGKVTYESSNTNVATVSEDGTVTPVAEGETTITASVEETETYSAATASYTLTVKKAIVIEDGVFDFNLGADYGSGLEPSSSNDYFTDATTWKAVNVVMTVDGKYRWWAASNGNQLRIFTGGKITLTAPAGKVITKIDFDGSSPMTPNVGTLANGIWSGMASSVEFEYGTSKVQIDKITVTYGDAPAMEVTVGSTGFATLTPAYALDFTNTTIKAYTATVSGDQITLTKKDQVAAGEGVLIYAEGGKTEEIPAATSAEKDASNAFVGTLKDIESLATEVTDGKNYILSIVNGKVGFYQAAGKKVGAGKAYLHVAGASEAKQVYEIDLNAIVTGINSAVNNKTADGKMYNLNGQRVGAGYKGVVIVNGKKVIKSL